jgi:hypothetical protein
MASTLRKRLDLRLAGGSAVGVISAAIHLTVDAAMDSAVSLDNLGVKPVDELISEWLLETSSLPPSSRVLAGSIVRRLFEPDGAALAALLSVWRDSRRPFASARRAREGLGDVQPARYHSAVGDQTGLAPVSALGDGEDEIRCGSGNAVRSVGSKRSTRTEDLLSKWR